MRLVINGPLSRSLHLMTFLSWESSIEVDLTETWATRCCLWLLSGQGKPARWPQREESSLSGLWGGNSLHVRNQTAGGADGKALSLLLA